MLKILLCIFTATVSFGVVNCDLECFMSKISSPIYSNTLAGLDKACLNYPFVIKSLREDIQSCEVSKISVDGLESFFRDFCAPDSSILQNFMYSKECLLEKFSTLTCMPHVSGEDVSEKLKDECKKREDMESCFVNGAGKPCNAEIFSVRAMKAFESFVKGICEEVGGAAVNKVTLWCMLLCIGLFVMKWHWT